jgi:type II secretory pathway predicted ATPase ExeA
MNNVVQDFFGLSRMPFSKNIPPQEVFKSRAYEEALARLEYGVRDEDMLLLTGPIGSGKSLTLKSFIHSLDTNRYTPIYLRGNNLSESDLFKTVLSGLDIKPPHFPQAAKLLFFKTVPELTKKPVIIIDDSQELKDSALYAIKSMTNFDYDSDNKVTFILAGQPELKAILKLKKFLSLKQRIRLFFHMTSLSLEETCGYIDHNIKICGNQNSIFSDDAKNKIHLYSEGIPRKINAVCYRSVLNAAIKAQSIIDSSNIMLEDPTE